mmetsp:Transcript_12143/g.30907  ORF Transcript_12143/g.30907 Transcript_12143/m.30907 type:complete len:115 (-) Transcript_12143:559-903(-)
MEGRLRAMQQRAALQRVTALGAAAEAHEATLAALAGRVERALGADDDVDAAQRDAMGFELVGVERRLEAVLHELDTVRGSPEVVAARKALVRRINSGPLAQIDGLRARFGIVQR